METAPSNWDFPTPGATSLASHPPLCRRQEVDLGEGRFPSGPSEELGSKVGFKASAALLGGRFSGLTVPMESQGEGSVLVIQANRPCQTKDKLSASSPVGHQDRCFP